LGWILFEFAVAAALQWGGFVSPPASVAMWFVAVLAALVLALTSESVAPRARAFGGRHPLLFTIIACALGATLFGVASRIFLRAYAAGPAPGGTTSAQPSVQPAVVDPFSVTMRSVLISDAPGPLSMFMVAYRSTYGQTASPVFCLARIQILNRESVPTNIEAYTVAVSDNSNGPWIELLPIPLTSHTLYALGAKGRGSTLEIPRGVYRLGTAMKPKDMRRAALMKPEPTLDSELRRPIQPHETISGWAAFDLPKEKWKVREYFRISVRDTANRSFASVVAAPRGKQHDPEVDPQPGLIARAGPVQDISRFRVRFYHDPLPPPTEVK